MGERSGPGPGGGRAVRGRRGGRRGPHPDHLRGTGRTRGARGGGLPGQRGRAGRPGRHLGAEHPGLDRRGTGRGVGGRRAGPAQHPVQGRGGGGRPAARRGAAAVRDGHLPRHLVRGVAAASGGGGPGRRPAARPAGPGTRGRALRGRSRRIPHLEGLPGERRGGGVGGRAREGGRGRRSQSLGHHLHLGHDGPPQGRRDHPRADAAGVRHLERAGGPGRRRPVPHRQPLLPHLRLQGRGDRLPDAGRDDDPPAGVRREHGPGQHRRGTRLRAPRPPDPPPVPPGPPGTRRARPVGPAPGGDGSGGGAAAAGRAPARRTRHRHGPDRVRPLRSGRSGHHVAGAATTRR